MLKRKALRDFLSSIDLRESQLIGYNPQWASNCQYVAGYVDEDGELCLVYSTYAPQVDRITEERSKFIVFSSIENSLYDLRSLVGVIHHSSISHELTIKVFALSDFNSIS
jgi:hypothetical protein